MKYSSGSRRWPAVVITAVVVTAFVAACEAGGGDGGRGAVERPLQLNETTVRKTFHLVDVNGNDNDLAVGRIGEKTIAGVAWPRYWCGRADGQNTDGPEVWLTWTADQAVVAGGEVYWAGSGIVPAGTPVVSGTADQPVLVDLNPPVGAPQTVHVNGNAVLGDPAAPVLEYPLDTDVTYTLEEDNATVQTSLGPISGCRRFTASTVVAGTTYDGEVWFHPTLGMVSGHVSWPPPNGVSLDIRDLKDLGTPADGWNELQGMALLSPENTSFTLDTFDVRETFDADKNSHAKMLLELRWADETKARTQDAPPVDVEFGTVWGVFPHELVQSPVSIFHPEENGNGFTYWLAFVDQAAKNEPENGIAYHVRVRQPDYLSSAVRATARIHYALFTP